MLEELYSNAYLYTLPSDLEGMPLSLLEAMSYEMRKSLILVNRQKQVIMKKVLSL